MVSKWGCRGVYRPRVLGQWFDGTRFYAAASSPTRSRRNLIPAGAGKPAPSVTSPSTSTVYPRGCGEAASGGSHTHADTGLSPRVRGSLAVARINGPEEGSIPAGAGKPGRGLAGSWRGRVYPRGCGEASYSNCPWYSKTGLSPRVRGSLRHLLPRRTGRGSIPAGAGKPRCPMTPPCSRRVYPRGCGEARNTLLLVVYHSGLSPRVRGSPRRVSGAADRVRSIPAGAGKPSRAMPCASSYAVYPRGCGEAEGCAGQRPRLTGLSPRVRGSRIIPGGRLVSLGSIPAGAGKPSSPSGRRPGSRVYPRGCGEAVKTVSAG